MCALFLLEVIVENMNLNDLKCFFPRLKLLAQTKMPGHVLNFDNLKFFIFDLFSQEKYNYFFCVLYGSYKTFYNIFAS